MSCRTINVLVDGVIYQLQSHGGISRVFNEILPRACFMDDSLRINILTQGPLKQLLPQHPNIIPNSIPHVNCLYPKRFWGPAVNSLNKFMQNLKIGNGKNRIWHSTYYTLPGKWAGRSVVTVHDMVFERFPEFYNGASFDLFRQRKRLAVQHADAVICVSDTTRQDILRLYEVDSDKLHVVHNAYSSAFKRMEDVEMPQMFGIEQPFLLYVGNRNHYKNFDVLAKAYSRWSQKKEISLVLVGGRDISVSERHLIEELGITDRIKLLKNIDDETLCRIYNCALALVYPSSYEGFGIPLLEAMACGCPVVASRIPSTTEVAGDCPIYFDPTEEDDLTNGLDLALSEGLNSERIRTSLGRVKSYSWDKTASGVLQVYRNLFV